MGDKIETHTLDALLSYFKYLESTGYANEDEVYGLIGLSLVETFLNSDLNVFVSEEDYNIMDRFLYCIFNKSCLIPYIKYKESSTLGSPLINIKSLRKFKHTEDNNIRINTDNILQMY